jgi:glutathione S-transferase
MALKLFYFPIRGRGEQVRLLLHALGVPFEDVRVGRDEFMAMKQEGPRTLTFGSLPMLQDGDFRLVQGPAIMSYLGRGHGAAPADAKAAARAEAITLGAEDLRIQYFKLFGDGAEAKQAEFASGPWVMRWLPNFEGLLELAGNREHFAGRELTFGDVAVWDVLDAVITYTKPASLAGFSRLQAFYDSFAARPAVAKYLAVRPA